MKLIQVLFGVSALIIANLSVVANTKPTAIIFYEDPATTSTTPSCIENIRVQPYCIGNKRCKAGTLYVTVKEIELDVCKYGEGPTQ